MTKQASEARQMPGSTSAAPLQQYPRGAVLDVLPGQQRMHIQREVLNNKPTPTPTSVLLRSHSSLPQPSTDGSKLVSHGAKAARAALDAAGGGGAAQHFEQVIRAALLKQHSTMELSKLGGALSSAGKVPGSTTLKKFILDRPHLFALVDVAREKLVSCGRPLLSMDPLVEHVALVVKEKSPDEQYERALVTLLRQQRTPKTMTIAQLADAAGRPPGRTNMETEESLRAFLRARAGLFHVGRRHRLLTNEYLNDLVTLIADNSSLELESKPTSGILPSTHSSLPQPSTDHSKLGSHHSKPAHAMAPNAAGGATTHHCTLTRAMVPSFTTSAMLPLMPAPLLSAANDERASSGAVTPNNRKRPAGLSLSADQDEHQHERPSSSAERKSWRCGGGGMAVAAAAAGGRRWEAETREFGTLSGRRQATTAKDAAVANGGMKTIYSSNVRLPSPF